MTNPSKRIQAILHLEASLRADLNRAERMEALLLRSLDALVQADTAQIDASTSDLNDLLLEQPAFDEIRAQAVSALARTLEGAKDHANLSELLSMLSASESSELTRLRLDLVHRHQEMERIASRQRDLALNGMDVTQDWLRIVVSALSGNAGMSQAVVGRAPAILVDQKA